MAYLVVHPPHLEGLATTQDGASKDMDSAIAATDGISNRVWRTHGIYVAEANLAIHKAEVARKRAGQSAQMDSADLAGRLRIARRMYERIDERAAEGIDK
jgi:hypothetical protein